MLIKYGLGVKKTQLDLEEVDDTFFTTMRDEEEL